MHLTDDGAADAPREQGLPTTVKRCRCPVSKGSRNTCATLSSWIGPRARREKAHETTSPEIKIKAVPLDPRSLCSPRAFSFIKTQ